ncbi:hypothetical protein ES708_32548 [subsurface metagenome]
MDRYSVSNFLLRFFLFNAKKGNSNKFTSESITFGKLISLFLFVEISLGFFTSLLLQFLKIQQHFLLLLLLYILYKIVVSANLYKIRDKKQFSYFKVQYFLFQSPVFLISKSSISYFKVQYFLFQSPVLILLGFSSFVPHFSPLTHPLLRH